MTTFLAAQDIITLTGIRCAKSGQTREQRQIAALSKMGVPHFVNAAGRPVVARAAVEGQASSATAQAGEWEPAGAGA